MTREFYTYFAARQSAVTAFTIEDVAVSWQIFSLRHSPFDLGLVGLILFLPQLLLALPAGVLADRRDRRGICMLSTLGEAVALCVFIALVLLHIREPAYYFLTVALIGIVHTAGIPAQRSLLVNIVRREDFSRSQALSSSAQQLAAIAGPAVGGLLVALGSPYAFGAAALAYAGAAIGFTFLHRHRAPPSGEPAMRSALQGVQFIFTHRVILSAISLDLFAVLFGGATALLPVFATSILHVGATGFGFLRAAPAIGAVLVALYLARHAISRKAGRMMIVCVAGFGAATIVFGVSHSFALSLVALALTGAFDMVSVVIRSNLVQLGTPDAMRGRVSAVENIFIGASNELGAFESGGLAALIGPQASVVAGGCATLAVIALWTLIFPELRRIDTI